MSGPTVHMFSAFDIIGFEYDGRQIWWETDSAQPTYSIRADCGRWLSRHVENPAFHVPPGPVAKRRTAMRRAALAFFDPLIKESKL